jgi:hypothetical protein
MTRLNSIEISRFVVTLVVTQAILRLIPGHLTMKEAGAGIEPANSGFADRDLTTWLPRRS